MSAAIGDNSGERDRAQTNREKTAVSLVTILIIVVVVLLVLGVLGRGRF
jgi:hypothetical protein